MTADLLMLREWLSAADCTHAAMESTGVYWKPIWNALEGSLTLLLVNAQHRKAVPGRKTDVKDAKSDCGTAPARAARPSALSPIRRERELRELTRYRTAIVRERANASEPPPEGLGRRQHQVGECRHR